MSTPPPPPGPHGPTHPTPPSRAVPGPAPTSLVGPVSLTAAGAVLLVATAVIAVLVARTFAGLIPTGLLTLDGEPGDDVVVAMDAPGTATATLEPDTRYVVLVAVPTPPRGADDDDLPELEDDVRVTRPDGSVAEADLSPGVNLSSSAGGTSLHSVGAFRTGAGGEHTLTAGPVEGPGGQEARVLVAVDQPFMPFFGGIFGTVFGVLAAVACGLIGVPMLVVGIVWWRRRAAARSAATRTR